MWLRPRMPTRPCFATGTIQNPLSPLLSARREGEEAPGRAAAPRLESSWLRHLARPRRAAAARGESSCVELGEGSGGVGEECSPHRITPAHLDRDQPLSGPAPVRTSPCQDQPLSEPT